MNIPGFLMTSAMSNVLLLLAATVKLQSLEVSAFPEPPWQGLISQNIYMAFYVAQHIDQMYQDASAVCQSPDIRNVHLFIVKFT